MAVHHAELHPLVTELDTNIRIAFVIADFNPQITHELKRINTEYLIQQGFSAIDYIHVPGAFELPAITTQVAEKGIYHLIITIGCLIKGETPHFDIIAQAATTGLTQVNMQYDTPLIFGLLTCNTLEQATARIDANYAIYGLNYVVQHLQAQNLLDERYETLMEQAQAVMQQTAAES